MTRVPDTPMQLRSLALLLALLPGLIAPAGMSWCTALCTVLRGAEATTQAPAKHPCCESRERTPAAPTQGTQLRAGCNACKVLASPKSDLQKLETAAAAVSLAPPSAAPFITLPQDAPIARVRAVLLPPATAGPGLAPLPLRI